MDFYSRVKAVVSLRDLQPGVSMDEAGLMAVLEPFDPVDLAQVLARLNFLYFSKEVRESQALRDGLLQLHFPPEIFNRVRSHMQNGARPLMHRLMVAGLLERIIRQDVSKCGTVRASQEPERVGMLLLAANLVFFPDNDVDGDPDSLVRYFSAEFYRDSFFSHDDNFGATYARYWAMFTHGQVAAAARYSTEVVDVEKECFEHLGMTPAETFKLGMGLLTRYFLKIETLIANPGQFLIGSGYFHTLKSLELRARAEQLLNRLGRDWEGHAQRFRADQALMGGARYQLFGLYDAPLMHLGDVSYPLDPQFLRHQLTEGLPWALLVKLTREKGRKDGDKALAWYGRLFEWYISQLIDSAIHKKGGTRRFLEWDGTLVGQGQGLKLPDAVIVEGKWAFFIEVTTSQVPPRNAISGDAAQLTEGLRRVWFGSGPATSAKLVQLAGAVKAFRDGRLTLDGVASKDISRVVPVLVVLRHLPQNEILWRLYRDVMLAGGLDRAFIDDLHIIDADDFEVLLQLRTTGKKLRTLIEERRRSDYRDDEFNVFFSYRKLYSQPHKLVEAWKDELVEATKATLAASSGGPP
jgi:hypothetical protein